MKRVERFDNWGSGSMYRDFVLGEQSETAMHINVDTYRVVFTCPCCEKPISLPVYGISSVDCPCGATTEFDGQWLETRLRPDTDLGRSAQQRGLPSVKTVEVPVPEWVL